MNARPIVGMIPPGGWHYFEGDVKLSSSTYQGLINDLQHYRAENTLPSGDPIGDIAAYICGNWPNYCQGVDMVNIVSHNPPTQTTELLNDIQVWVKNLLQSEKAIAHVSDETAENRAKICRACPNNVNWRGGCGACIASTDSISAVVRHAKDTESSQVLGGCSVMRHDNRTAIFLETEYLEKAPNLPEHCWVK